MGDEATMAWAMERLGSAIWDMGSHTEAEAMLQQALALLRHVITSYSIHYTKLYES